jgi:single-stranded-DNA-specific exonuclease
VLNKYKELNKQSLFELLSSRFYEDDKKLSQIPNPNLLHDASDAAKYIAKAIRENKKIVVVGDYDVDGVSSTAIILDFFKQIPYPIKAIIPNRFEDGYGISPNLLNKIDAELIITVDNGITAIEAAKVCKQKGIDLIITDHHTPSDTLPDALFIIDPKLKECNYPFKEICGAEVAWLLLALIKKELALDIDMKQFLDILAIAIIADIMPLVDINRILVKEGLKLIKNSKRPSSIIIRDYLDKTTITSEDIAFLIAPRINSAGRLEDATIALEFFTAKDTFYAYKQFELLTKLNDLRKETEAQATKEAIEYVNKDDLITVVANNGWHEGVVGIVASRLVDKFEKPAIVLNISDGIAKGSARSIGDVNIYNLIKENESYLSKFGGHKMAAGLSLNENNIEKFREAINKSAKLIDPNDFIPKDSISGIFDSQDIDDDILSLLDKFEPYGEANPKPIFLFENAEVVSVKLMGADKSHSKIEIRQYPHQKKTLELIAFRTVYDISKNKKITCSYTISKNEFNSKIKPQLLVNKIY